MQNKNKKKKLFIVKLSAIKYDRNIFQYKKFSHKKLLYKYYGSNLISSKLILMHIFTLEN
jgi:hypothetical protein